jgi:hypothetical protein
MRLLKCVYRDVLLLQSRAIGGDFCTYRVVRFQCLRGDLGTSRLAQLGAFGDGAHLRRMLSWCRHVVRRNVGAVLSTMRP